MHGSQPALTQIAKWEQEEDNCRRNRDRKREREEMGEGLGAQHFGLLHYGVHWQAVDVVKRRVNNKF